MRLRDGPAGALDLERLGRRQPDEVRTWFETYFAVVHGFVRRRVAAYPTLADDVTQETFLVALRHIGEYDPQRGAMLPWLTYIARNCARKALRRARPEMAVDFDDAAESVSLPDLDSGPLPEEVLARAETVDRVHAALEALAPMHQRVLERHYFLGEPLKQIAVTEATTVSAVKSGLHRARLAFRAAFEAGGGSRRPVAVGGRER